MKAQVISLLVLAIIAPSLLAADPPKFRLAYVEAYKFWSYDEHYQAFQKALADLGWADRVEYPPELHFNWQGDKTRYRERAREILARKDFDLLISLGTETTLVILEENREFKRPVLGMSISNPLGAGIIPGPDDSGSPYFTTVNFGELPGPYMFILFHSLVGFRSLGLMYHDSPAGRSYTYLKDAREVARDRGFKLVEYNRLSQEESLEECRTGVRYLLDQGVEAIFIPNINCFDTSTNCLKPLYRMIYERGVATFASEDFDQVRLYALMGLYFSDPASLGRFQAGQAAAILSGTPPGQVPMITNFNSRLLLNLAAAESLKKHGRLNLKIGPEVLALSDRLHLTLPGLDRPCPAPSHE